MWYTHASLWLTLCCVFNIFLIDSFILYDEKIYALYDMVLKKLLKFLNIKELFLYFKRFLTYVV